MIIVTGGAGFIGSALIWALNEKGFDDIIIVDQLGHTKQWQNLVSKNFDSFIHKNNFLTWLEKKGGSTAISAIFHFGACSSTSESNADYLMDNNLNYSIELYNYARSHGIPFFYASSAATYGAGEQGYKDNLETTKKLRPINPYGYSKHLFDQWVLRQKKHPPFWAGFKFFNVYGPNEYHKENMCSLVAKAVPQIKKNQSLRLFKSGRKDIADGEQKRDFIYIKDVVEIILHFWQSSMSHQAENIVQSGIYNVGTGKARSFADLGRAVFSALDLPCQFKWVETPLELRAGYQYFTEADLERLKNQGGYKGEFTSLEEGVRDYVCHYLTSKNPYL